MDTKLINPSTTAITAFRILIAVFFLAVVVYCAACPNLINRLTNILLTDENLFILVRLNG